MASEFLKDSKNETLTAAPMSQEPAHNEEEDQEGNPETKRSKPSPFVSSSFSSPSKRSGKAVSKKQQRFAEAAKNSRCISKYFGKKAMDDTLKNGEAKVLEPEETSVFVETPHNCDVVLNTGNPETPQIHSMNMESTEKKARPVESQTMDAIPIDMSATDVEMCRTEEATRSFEERTMLEAEGYDHVMSFILFLVAFLFLCCILDSTATVWNVLSMFFALFHTHYRKKSQSYAKVKEKVKFLNLLSCVLGQNPLFGAVHKDT